ncbi:hypothetical protein YC2023_075901 [Brassica napus]
MFLHCTRLLKWCSLPLRGSSSTAVLFLSDASPVTSPMAPSNSQNPTRFAPSRLGAMGYFSLMIGFGPLELHNLPAQIETAQVEAYQSPNSRMKKRFRLSRSLVMGYFLGLGAECMLQFPHRFAILRSGLHGT